MGRVRILLGLRWVIGRIKGRVRVTVRNRVSWGATVFFISSSPTTTNPFRTNTHTLTLTLTLAPPLTLFFTSSPTTTDPFRTNTIELWSAGISRSYDASVLLIRISLQCLDAIYSVNW